MNALPDLSRPVHDGSDPSGSAGRRGPGSADGGLAPAPGSDGPNRHCDELRDGGSIPRTALLCAVVAFGATSLLAVAAADWPPPAGFLWLEGLLGLFALVVYTRVLMRLRARSQGRRIRLAAFEGAIAGLAAGVILLLVSSAGEPDVTPTSLDNAVGFLVIASVGAAAAQALWGLAILLDRSSTTPAPRNADTSQ